MYTLGSGLASGRRLHPAPATIKFKQNQEGVEINASARAQASTKWNKKKKQLDPEWEASQSPFTLLGVD